MAKALGVPTIRGLGPVVGILAIGLIISAVAYTLAKRVDDQRVQHELESRALQRVYAFERRLVSTMDSLEALAFFVATERKLDAASFHHFAHLDHDSDDVNSALVWGPLVRGPDREAFVAANTSAADRDFEIRERAPNRELIVAPERDEYLPELFEETYDGKPGVAGFDLLSLPLLRSQVQRARDHGTPSASPPLTVFLGTTQRTGLTVFWPIYSTGDVPDTDDKRRAAFRGAVFARLGFDRVLPALIASSPEIQESIAFLIDRGTEDEPPLQIGAYDPVTGKVMLGETPIAARAGSVSIIREFDNYERHWTIRLDFPPEVTAKLRSGGPLAWLVFGFALTALTAAYFAREHARRRGVEAVVTERTADMQAANRTLALEVEVRRAAEAQAWRSQALTAATLDASPFAIMSLGADKRVLLWNRAAQHIFGFTADEVIGRPNPLVGDDTEVSDQISKRLAAGEVIRSQRIRRRRKDGKSLQVQFSAAAVRDGDRVLAFVGMYEDVTERNLIDQQLVQAQKMEAIGNLTGGMAHDFNNLLGVIVGNLDLLRDLAKENVEIDELAKDALDAALRGADLTSRLLAFARRQPLAPQCIALNDLVSNIVELLRRTLGEQIAITLDLARAIWPVMVDPMQLEAAITNLATNARDAMPKGGRLTIVTANRHLDDDYAALHAEVTKGDYVMIEVTDTGTGMTPEVVAKIFEPFYSTKELGKGTGLGLSMVFGFMNQSGGHINVYSEPGVGTTFRLYLPRAFDPVEEIEPAAKSEPMPQASGEIVLAVEDNAALRRIVVRQLTELGYRVVAAESASAALAVLDHEKIDLLFTDIVMPGEVDGYGLARRVSQLWPKVKIVLTSGFPETNLTGAFGAPAPADRLLSKPYRREELARAIREALAS